MFCWRHFDLDHAVGMIINHEESRYIKKIIIKILRDYAQRSNNLIDDALVNEVERRLLYAHTPLQQQLQP